MELDHVDAFVKALESAFYVDKEMISVGISQRTSFNLVHLETMFKVDIFLPKNRPFDQQQFARRVKRVIDKDSGREVYFASPEDTILAKLEWFRRGGEVSEIQWGDIKAILQQRSDQLDLKYMKGSANGLKISDLLKRSLEESHK
jgi:hypothetical protein